VKKKGKKGGCYVVNSVQVGGSFFVLKGGGGFVFELKRNGSRDPPRRVKSVWETQLSWGGGVIARSKKKGVNTKATRRNPLGGANAGAVK